MRERCLLLLPTNDSYGERDRERERERELIFSGVSQREGGERESDCVRVGDNVITDSIAMVMSRYSFMYLFLPFVYVEHYSLYYIHLLLP